MRGWSPQVEPCPPEARERALHVLYQRVPESLRLSLVLDVLKDASRGALDLSGLWIARNQLWGPEWLGPRSEMGFSRNCLGERPRSGPLRLCPLSDEPRRRKSWCSQRFVICNPTGVGSSKLYSTNRLAGKARSIWCAAACRGLLSYCISNVKHEFRCLRQP